MRPSPGIAGVVLCAALSGCESGPTAPDRIPPELTGPLPAGRYSLSIASPLEMEDSQAPGCTGPLDSWGLFGPTVTTTVILSRVGDAWAGGLERPAEGSLELELRVRLGVPGELALSGTLRGTAVDIFDRASFTSSPPRTVSIAGPAGSASATIGAVAYQSLGLIGRAKGDVTFTHTSGTTVSCPEVTLLLTYMP